MAIVRMKRLRVIAMAKQRDQLLARLHHAGCVELSEPQAELSNPEWTALLERSESQLSDVRQQLALVQAALVALQKYVPVKAGMFPKRQTIQEEDFFSAKALELALKNAGAIQSREKEVADLLGQQARLTAKKTALRPWAALDVDLGMTSTKHVTIAFLVCPRGVDLSALTQTLAQAAPSAQVAVASSDKEQHYFLYLCHRKEEAEGAEVLKAFGVTPAGLKDVSGTAINSIDTLNRESEALEAKQRALVEEIQALAGCRQDLSIATDRLRQEESKQAAAQRSLTDNTIVFFTGWVTEAGEAKALAELEKFPCAWQTEAPAPEEYPQVPIKLENNWFTRPLNMVTEMYSLPSYGGIDPNPVMAPFFILFYGVMMADMGYGLLMMLASFLILKRGKPQGGMHHFFSLLGLCGVSTFLMGAITGGFFGDFIPQVVLLTTGKEIALPALFNPLDDALMVLIGSLALGVIQIFTGMAISMVKQFRRGEGKAALCNEGAWYVVFLLLGVAAITGAWSVCLLAILLLLLLTQGYGKKGIAAKAMGIFGSLYNNLTGYFSDILSYSRLMALMLAGAVIAQVFNTLGAITGNLMAFVLISAVGNTLNFGLNLLGCYVHDLRLQCLEYFGRFYEDGGKPFNPLTVPTKHVDII